MEAFMVQESPTAQETQAEVPLPTAAAEAPPVPELGTDEPQTTVAEEETAPAPEAGELPPEREAPQSPWASLTDPYEVLDLPEFKTHLQRRDSRMEEQLRQNFSKQYEAATKDWESMQAHQTINGLVGNLSARLDGADMEGAERMLARLEKFREPYMEAYRNQLQVTGATGTATQLFNTLMGTLDVRGQDELHTVASSQGADWKRIFEKYGELREKGADERAYKRLKKDRDAAGAASQQVQQAKGSGPNLAPGSPTGSGKYTAEQWTAMSTAERNQARAEGRHPLSTKPT